MKNPNNGMKTRVWGPAAWTFLFCSVLGTYPIKLDENDKEHVKKRDAFKKMFQSLAYTMPCFFCRDSYKNYLVDMSLDNALTSRRALAKWLYTVKDKVNKKLIKCEKMHFEEEKDKILKKYEAKKISKQTYLKTIKELKNSIMITKPSIPFESVIAKYEKIRA